MKAANALLAGIFAGLLCGCGQQKPDPSIAEIQQKLSVLESNTALKEKRWEYKVEIERISFVGNSVAVAKNDLADAEYDLASAKIDNRLAMRQITDSQAHDAKIDAQVDLKIKKDSIEDDREESVRTNLLAVISEQSAWELVAANPLPSHEDKFILIFKRSVK